MFFITQQKEQKEQKEEEEEEEEELLLPRESSVVNYGNCENSVKLPVGWSHCLEEKAWPGGTVIQGAVHFGVLKFYGPTTT